MVSMLVLLPEIVCSRARPAREVRVHGVKQFAWPRTTSPSTLVHSPYPLSRSASERIGTLLPGHSTVEQKVKVSDVRGRVSSK